MTLKRLLPVLAFLVLSSAKLDAEDLARIERIIAKEPAYRSQPKYCLLVFGREARTRLWLVQDGDALYVDRNGNGDLTEPGKKVSAEKNDNVEAGEYEFKVGDVRDGARLHKNLIVGISKLDHLADQDDTVKEFLAKNPKARWYSIHADVEMPGRKGTGVGGRVCQHTFYADVNGFLQFADRPQEAPVVHFDGPLQITLFGRQQLMVGREVDVVLGVGTAGVGPGSTAFMEYEGGAIPEKLYPVVDIVYPPRHPGDRPVHEQIVLKRRC
jgi:hypothetical protein